MTYFSRGHNFIFKKSGAGMGPENGYKSFEPVLLPCLEVSSFFNRFVSVRIRPEMRFVKKLTIFFRT